MRQLRRIGCALALVSLTAPAFAMGGFGVTNMPVVYLDGTSFQQLANVANVTLLVGDFNGDHRTDMALIGGSSWGSVPVAFSGGDGTFNLTNRAFDSRCPNFASDAATPGARPLVGDFNGDGKADIALIGPPAWGFVSMAFSNGDGTFTCTRMSSILTGWSNNNFSPEALVGDFDGDGKDDIALIGPGSWHWIVVGYSDGGGSFTVGIQSTSPPNDFGNWASLPNVHPLIGDFNHDGIKDIALTGNSDWGSLPVAFGTSTRGAFNITNQPISEFATWASKPNAHPLVGDFNHDGKDDVALTGVSGWDSVPVAFSNGDGTFTVTNTSILDFAGYATDPAAKILVGDFNGDGLADIALTGPSDWQSIPVAFSHGDGSFVVTNQPIVNFGNWASSGTPVVGDFNDDHKADVAVMGPGDWVDLPVAFSLSPNVTP
jgi:hypothetical protein